MASKASHFANSCRCWGRSQALSKRVSDGSLQIPRQCTFRNACWRLGSRHFYIRFRLRRVPDPCILRKSCWRRSPSHFCNLFQTGACWLCASALFVTCVDAPAPGKFTTGAGWVPTCSERVHFSSCMLLSGPQALLQRFPHSFQWNPRQGIIRNAWPPGARTDQGSIFAAFKSLEGEGKGSEPEVEGIPITYSRLGIANISR